MLSAARQLITATFMPRLEPLAHFEAAVSTSLCSIVGSYAEQNIIEKEVDTLAKSDQGAQLFRRLHITTLVTERPLKISLGGESTYNSDTNEITLSRKPSDGYYLSAKDNLEVEFGIVHRDAALLHEGLHAIHCMENPRAFNMRAEVDRGNFTNLEEELTITGRASHYHDQLFENAYLRKTGRPLRLSHIALTRAEALSITSSYLRTATTAHRTALSVLNGALKAHIVQEENVDSLLAAASDSRSSLLFDSVRDTLSRHNFDEIE